MAIRKLSLPLMLVAGGLLACAAGACGETLKGESTAVTGSGSGPTANVVRMMRTGAALAPFTPVLTASSQDNRPFPRLFIPHYVITRKADTRRLAKWDWIMVTPSVRRTRRQLANLRAANPNATIMLYVNGSEDNGHDFEVPAVTPTAVAAGMSRRWWAHNADGSHISYPWYPGNRVINITPQATRVHGKRYPQHLTHWIAATYPKFGMDAIAVDMVNDPNAQPRGFNRFADYFPHIDLDNDHIADRAEHGMRWINDQWAAGGHAIMSELRRKVGDAQILVADNGLGLTGAGANGIMLESGLASSPVIRLLQHAETSHFGPGFSTLITPAGTYSRHPQTDYKLMRHNLVAAMLGGAYSAYADGDGRNGGYSAEWWYDEYSVDLATGDATGDASHKGYLGAPIDRAQQLPNGVWRRDSTTASRSSTRRTRRSRSISAERSGGYGERKIP